MSFTILGVRVRFTIWFFAVLSVFLLIDRTGLGILGFLACLLHEAAHVAAMLLCRRRLLEITFLPFGIRIRQESGLSKGYGAELLILAAGPALNLLLGAVLLLAACRSCPRIAAFGIVNIFLGTFNLLPAGVLDGGGMLALFLRWSGHDGKADSICFIITVILLIPLFTLGIYLFFKSRYNFTLLFTVLYIFILSIKQYGPGNA